MKNIDRQFLEDLEFRYRYLTAVRYSRKQKDKFIDIFRREMNHLGIRNDAIKIIKEGKAVNVVVGDIDKADVIIINNYDTPPFTLFNKTWFPFNWKKQQETMIRSIIFMMIATALTTLLAYFAFNNMGAFDPTEGKTNYLFSVFAVISTALMLRIVNGIGRKDNLQFTSPQIILDVLLAKELTNEGINFAIVLTDYGYQRHIGDLGLKHFELKNKKVYFISDLVGDKVDIITNPQEVATVQDIVPHIRIVSASTLIDGEHRVDYSKGTDIANLDSIQNHLVKIMLDITQH